MRQSPNHLSTPQIPDASVAVVGTGSEGGTVEGDGEAGHARLVTNQPFHARRVFVVAAFRRDGRAGGGADVEEGYSNDVAVETAGVEMILARVHQNGCDDVIEDEGEKTVAGAEIPEAYRAIRRRRGDAREARWTASHVNVGHRESVARPGVQQRLLLRLGVGGGAITATPLEGLRGGEAGREIPSEN